MTDFFVDVWKCFLAVKLLPNGLIVPEDPFAHVFELFPAHLRLGVEGHKAVVGLGMSFQPLLGLSLVKARDWTGPVNGSWVVLEALDHIPQSSWGELTGV